MIEAMSELPAICDAQSPGTEAAKWPTGTTSAGATAPVYSATRITVAARPNENTNRLLRLVRKRHDLADTKAEIQRIQDTLNKRPRPTWTSTPRDAQRTITSSSMNDVDVHLTSSVNLRW